MDNLSKVKAEIERNISHYEKMDRHDFTNGELYICQEPLSFIESLEKEREADLEKEICEQIDIYYKNIDEELNKEECDLSAFNLDGFARHFYDLGLNAQNNAPKIKGWVARDKYDRLGLYDQKPTKDLKGVWLIGDDWIGRFGLSRVKPNIICNTDEPIEVELTIHRVCLRKE